MKYVSPAGVGNAQRTALVAADRRLGPGRGDLLRPPLLGIGHPVCHPAARQRLAGICPPPGRPRADGRTHVNIESVQSGLGCVNSWGRLPRPEYLLPYGDYSFNFLLQPVTGGR